MAGASLPVDNEIPRVTPFERGLPRQVRRTADGKNWEPDEQLVDERWLGVHVAGKALVVFSARSHVGIVNVLIHARASFPDVPIHAVFGGLHLSGPNEQIIPQTVAAMKPFAPALIGAGRCTGWRALAALAEAFGNAGTGRGGEALFDLRNCHALSRSAIQSAACSRQR